MQQAAQGRKIQTTYQPANYYVVIKIWTTTLFYCLFLKLSDQVANFLFLAQSLVILVPFNHFYCQGWGQTLLPFGTKVVVDGSQLCNTLNSYDHLLFRYSACQMFNILCESYQDSMTYLPTCYNQHCGTDAQNGKSRKSENYIPTNGSNQQIYIHCT